MYLVIYLSTSINAFGLEGQQIVGKTICLIVFFVICAPTWKAVENVGGVYV